MDKPVSSSGDVFAKAPWRHILNRVVAPASNVPTMLSAEEQRLYHWLTSVWARGTGEIVDLGCFAGGSTARLAEGLRLSGLPSRIHAFDRFTAEESAKKRFLYPAGIAEFEGNDILPLAGGLLSPWKDLVTLYPGEIEDQAWEDGKIEILVVDAAKSASSLDALANTFYPYLVPGGIVVHQDYFLQNQPWVAAQMALLTECFQPVGVAGGTTAIFQCLRAPKAKDLKSAVTQFMDDTLLSDCVDAAGWQMAAFGRADRFVDMKTAIARNPRERNAWHFTR